MSSEFKAWDRIKKAMVYPANDFKSNEGCDFTISLNGSFSVTERVKMETGMREVCRNENEFDLLKSIGLRTKDNKNLFPGDFILDKAGNRMEVCLGEYKGPKDSWGVKPSHLGTYIIFEDGGTLALTQIGGGYSIAAGECFFAGHKFEESK